MLHDHLKKIDYEPEEIAQKNEKERIEKERIEWEKKEKTRQERFGKTGGSRYDMNRDWNRGKIGSEGERYEERPPATRSWRDDRRE